MDVLVLHFYIHEHILTDPVSQFGTKKRFCKLAAELVNI